MSALIDWLLTTDIEYNAILRPRPDSLMFLVHVGSFSDSIINRTHITLQDIEQRVRERIIFITQR